MEAVWVGMQVLFDGCSLSMYASTVKWMQFERACNHMNWMGVVCVCTLAKLNAVLVSLLRMLGSAP